MQGSPLMTAVLCAGLGVACGDRSGVAATGCLTATGDQFVLTETAAPAAGAAVTTTRVYKLISMEDELRKHVGKQITVHGRADADESQVADVRQMTPSQPAGTSGQQPDTQVSTQEHTRLAMQELRISSVTPTGEPCP